MSNWSRAKVNFKNVSKGLFEEAVKNMGYYINYDEHKVSGAYSFEDARKCDCVLYNLSDGTSANIGLSFDSNEDGEVTVNVVGDWWNKDYNDKTFTQALRLEYSTASMTKAAADNGYSVQEVEMIGEYKRRIVYAKVA